MNEDELAAGLAPTPGYRSAEVVGGYTDQLVEIDATILSGG